MYGVRTVTVARHRSPQRRSKFECELGPAARGASSHAEPSSEAASKFECELGPAARGALFPRGASAHVEPSSETASKFECELGPAARGALFSRAQSTVRKGVAAETEAGARLRGALRRRTTTFVVGQEVQPREPSAPPGARGARAIGSRLCARARHLGGAAARAGAKPRARRGVGSCPA